MEQKESKSNKHFRISVLKSGIRMLGCSAFIMNQVMIGGCLFFIAECFGIIEEMQYICNKFFFYKQSGVTTLKTER